MMTHHRSTNNTPRRQFIPHLLKWMFGMGNLFMILRTSTFLRTFKFYVTSIHGSTDIEMNATRIGYWIVQDNDQVTTPSGRGVDSNEQQQQLNYESKNNSLSFCLLIKDDNDILNEWIAYHFHAVRLRHLIVAVDPSSITSPEPILEVWREQFGLDFELWSDDRFMPEYFLQGQYHLVPRMIRNKDKNSTKWRQDDNKEDVQIVGGGAGVDNPPSTDEQDLRYTRINNHRFRQATFLQHCARTYQDRNHTWVAHIDTDEYIAINPILIEWQQQERGNQTMLTTMPNTTTAVTTQSTPQVGRNHPTLVPVPLDWMGTSRGTGESLVWDFLQDMVRVSRGTVNWPCISMPRILYGPIDGKGGNEGEGTTTSFISSSIFNTTKLETIRWKYHADLGDRRLNPQPKVIMDVSGFPPFDVSRRAFSIHRPSKVLCRKQGETTVYRTDRFPLVVHHYLGSWEQYFARDDPRRTKATYRDIVQAMPNGTTSTGNDYDWIDGWLASFVETHGIDKVRTVLGHYIKSGSNNDRRYWAN